MSKFNAETTWIFIGILEFHGGALKKSQLERYIQLSLTYACL